MRTSRLALLLAILVGALGAIALLLRHRDGDAAPPQLAGTWERLPGPTPPPGRQAAPAPLGDRLSIDDQRISWDGRSLPYRLVPTDGLVLLQADLDGDGTDDQTVLGWQTLPGGEVRFTINFGHSCGSWRRLAGPDG